MKKYWTIFLISFQKELQYRFNFLMGRLRSLIVLVLIYYVWYSLSKSSGTFASYTQAELFTYVFGVSILRSFIFGAQSRLTASEINSGSFAMFLVKPVNHFLFVFCRELAQRIIYFLFALIEAVIFIIIVNAKIFFQTDWRFVSLFVVCSVGALMLYFLLSYLMSIFAFWSREAMGPRFVFEWFLEFASGAYFPLDILSRVFFVTLSFLPFAFLIYMPIRVYLGKIPLSQAIVQIALQYVWVFSIGMLTIFVWKKGVRKFSAEGI
jgi:ABC-2 type transport system permease protein